MNTPTETNVKYFEVIRALHKGGLSLWLNHKTLLPMTMIPTIVTFLTLMVSRIDFYKDASPFQLALLQIPADFITGIFCSLVIFIILNAPSKKDKDAPVMFQLNILERKDLLIGGAVTYMIFGYLIGGAYGAMEMIFKPMQAAAENQEAFDTSLFLPLIAFMVIILYAMRFAILPILVIAEVDVVAFFKKFRGFGFSLPIFFVKAATALAVGLFLYIPLQGIFGVEEDVAGLPSQMAILDFGFAFGAVIAAAWGSAALAIGYRQMSENTQP